MKLTVLCLEAISNNLETSRLPPGQLVKCTIFIIILLLNTCTSAIVARVTFDGKGSVNNYLEKKNDVANEMNLTSSTSNIHFFVVVIIKSKSHNYYHSGLTTLNFLIILVFPLIYIDNGFNKGGRKKFDYILSRGCFFFFVCNNDCSFGYTHKIIVHRKR